MTVGASAIAFVVAGVATIVVVAATVATIIAWFIVPSTHLSVGAFLAILDFLIVSSVVIILGGVLLFDVVPIVHAGILLVVRAALRVVYIVIDHLLLLA